MPTGAVSKELSIILPKFPFFFFFIEVFHNINIISLYYSYCTHIMDPVSEIFFRIHLWIAYVILNAFRNLNRLSRFTVLFINFIFFILNLPRSFVRHRPILRKLTYILYIFRSYFRLCHITDIFLHSFYLS